ncbi:hypothetical protein M1L60_05595 [Actinoplanes sp. TRM 88003]|uniref:SMI1/KNR4 family protein n=1 Tax=Paractinoplanes aksuensis TaxID=2939490 RepID=A0ABT1DGW7_9ACTN|nr:hypothetical protein [Actinoplanes aksuensis]MCO8270064.1 hypothetical protein [Actinoplanes aksuensis]
MAAGVSLRPRAGTYGHYEYGDLPALPFELRGDFAWLDRQRPHEKWPILGNADASLPALIAACSHASLALPPPFVQFLGSADRQRRVRSSTACFVDLDVTPVPAPTGRGHLIRFLADQQGCVYWYLYLAAEGGDHAVVSSAGFYGTDDEDEDDVTIDFNAESFEAFMCRFWLENEIWFAATGGTPMPEGGDEYIARYHAASA